MQLLALIRFNTPTLPRIMQLLALIGLNAFAAFTAEALSSSIVAWIQKRRPPPPPRLLYAPAPRAPAGSGANPGVGGGGSSRGGS